MLNYHNPKRDFFSALFKGAWVRPSVFSIQLFSFFFNPYMDKGFENPEEKNLLFCNEFFIIILYIYII